MSNRSAQSDNSIQATASEKTDADAHVKALELSLTAADAFARQSLEETMASQEAVLTDLARAYGNESDPTFAQTFLSTSGETYSQYVQNQHYGKSDQVANVLFRLGQTRFLQGDGMQAIDALNRSIAAPSIASDPRLRSRALNMRGCVQATLGDWEHGTADFQESFTSLVGQPGSRRLAAIALRNLCYATQAQGIDGKEYLYKAIEFLAPWSESKSLTVEHEMLVDFRAELCLLLVIDGEHESAQRVCDQIQGDLQSLLAKTQNLAKRQAHRYRYEDALLQIRACTGAIAAEAVHDDQPEVSHRRPVPQWRPLVDLRSELVSSDRLLRGTMVGEFERQSSFAVAWCSFDWTERIVTSIAKHLSARADLVIVADNPDSLKRAGRSLTAAGVDLNRVDFRMLETEVPWFRDCGPIVSVAPGGRTIWFDSQLTRRNTDFRPICDSLPERIVDFAGTLVGRTPLRVEGGMLASNGRGLTITSEAMLQKNAEYGFSPQAIRDELMRITGAKELVVVPTLENEPTSHVDMFLTFVDPVTVVVGQYSDADDPNAAVLDEVARQLSEFNDDGQRLRVHRVPMSPRTDDHFRTYTNVVFGNGVLLVPSYAGHERLEADVRQIYQTLLPDWEIVFIDCTRLIELDGALHCLVTNLGPAGLDRTRGSVQVRTEAKRDESK
ncbi:agmatine deiminase family protein [Stieleria maiorica]|uniref:agmatine deiminase family protein n=1 Tax=Stieleria maiorica TaxID=2795974 RepID=UPI0011C7B555|nr:agmatine deiminase family protein [Stieleria maiorica]